VGGDVVRSPAGVCRSRGLEVGMLPLAHVVGRHRNAAPVPHRELLLAQLPGQPTQRSIELELAGGARRLRARDRRQPFEEVRADQSTAGRRREPPRQ
jgi:hypothetical protein